MQAHKATICRSVRLRRARTAQCRPSRWLSRAGCQLSMVKVKLAIKISSAAQGAGVGLWGQHRTAR